MIWVVVVAAAAVLDQALKFLVTKLIPFENSVTIIDRFFYITHWKNSGAAWGVFQNGRYIFIILTVLAVLVMAIIINRSNSRFLKFSLSLIIGGALGNLVDRVLHGYVTDFLQLKFWSYNFPVFNLADSMVVVGTILLAVYVLFMQKNARRFKYKIR
ncbi:MAG: signal peptidase II [Bacillota bacterium]|nr:signal peptidase II [Bacillota bacterium]